jgi:hypothetical protein
MTDIPLAKAQIIWNAHEDRGGPKLKVISIPGNDDQNYMASWGACNMEYNDADDATKLTMLLAKTFDLMLNEGITPVEIVEALSVIPEFRAELQENGAIRPD